MTGLAHTLCRGTAERLQAAIIGPPSPPVSSGIQWPSGSPKVFKCAATMTRRKKHEKKLDLFYSAPSSPYFVALGCGMRHAHLSHPRNSAGGNLSRECVGKTECGRKSGDFVGQKVL